MLQAAYNVHAPFPAPAGPGKTPPLRQPTPAEPAPPLPPAIARLFRIQRLQNELALQLERNMGRIALARAYLAKPGCNVLLGAARLTQLRDKRSELLARLRASRLEVLELHAFPHMQVNLPETCDDRPTLPINPS